MDKREQMVSLVTDLDALVSEMTSQPMWMVRPLHSRKYADQRMVTTAEVVDLETLNLARIKMFETE